MYYTFVKFARSTCAKFLNILVDHTQNSVFFFEDGSSRGSEDGGGVWVVCRNDNQETKGSLFSNHWLYQHLTIGFPGAIGYENSLI